MLTPRILGTDVRHVTVVSSGRCGRSVRAAFDRGGVEVADRVERGASSSVNEPVGGKLAVELVDLAT